MISFLISTWILAALIMLVFWWLYIQINNPGIVDVGWILVILISGLVAIGWHSGTGFMQNFAFILLCIWAIRLGGFLAITRVMAKKSDPRYEQIKNSFNKDEKINFLLNFQLQAFLASIVASNLYYALAPIKGSFAIYFIGLILVIVGIVGEAIADYQLFEHKSSGSNEICKRGFWEHSRHPNYFFELLVWSGFAVVGFGAKLNLFAFLSPIALWAIMKYITVPLTERLAIKKRPEYADYIKSTNEFIPYNLSNIFKK